MATPSYWGDGISLPSFPALERDLSVDVVIIGAGITGVTAAYLLARAGKRVALLERDRVAQADTLATTAHLTCVIDERLTELANHFGKDHARAVWDAGLEAIRVIEEAVIDHQIDCNFRRIPCFLHAALDPAKATDKDSRQALADEATLAAELGFDAHLVEADPLFKTPAMRVANQAAFHPLKYLAALLRSIQNDGGLIFENSNADEFSDNPLSVKSNGHTITCAPIILATHVPLAGVKGLVGSMLFQTKIYPYSSYVIGATVPKGSVPDASFYDTSDPYYYTRISPGEDHDLVIFGGEDHKTGQVVNTDEQFAKLEKLLKQFIPEASAHYRWSGQVVETNDGLPFIGPIADHQFIATGYGGNGMTFGTLGGLMASSWALGKKNPWADLFDPHRKKALGSAWDYIKENVDYPYYMAKKWLERPDGESTDAVGTNDGKVIKLHGQKVAAYRDDHGKLTLLSAVCTHMGCIVNWNNAEKTWDCPCHGSRFQCTGAVLAGPAETPLKPVEAQSGK
jgi:glycine/D-amino acid oxidase-like deaminating enzyme/nitrite reductase/ring-hydroxylating ferredoxin subunit